MKTTAYYLDALRAHYGVKSDYALSPLIGIAPPHISRFRKLQGTFSEEFCLKIADILDIDPAEIFLAMHHQREKNEAAKKVWERIYQSMTAVAAVLVLAVFVIPALPLDNSLGLALAGFVEAPGLYIMSNGFGLSWWIVPALVLAVATLALLAFPSDPLHPPKPKKEAENNLS